jgi:hypothetical protein
MSSPTLCGVVTTISLPVLCGVVTTDVRFLRGTQGIQGPPGPQTSVGQVDGGSASSVYGGTFLIYGGDASTVFS